MPSRIHTLSRFALAALSLASSVFAGDRSKGPRFELQVSAFGIHSVPSSSTAPKNAAVALIESAPWSPNDPARDGAREFEVLLTVASLARTQPLVGLVGVGNRAGVLRPESEKALERVCLMGVPVVKVAAKGQAEVDPDNLFIEAGSLDADRCRALLSECLLRFGALPSVADPFHPSSEEISRIRSHLESYQVAFASANDEGLVALR